MAKLYHVPVDGQPRVVLANTTPTAAGEQVYEWETEKAEEFEHSFHFLLHEGRLYRYISVPDGFGWERVDGEDGPAFAA